MLANNFETLLHAAATVPKVGVSVAPQKARLEQGRAEAERCLVDGWQGLSLSCCMPHWHYEHRPAPKAEVQPVMSKIQISMKSMRRTYRLSGSYVFGRIVAWAALLAMKPKGFELASEPSWFEKTPREMGGLGEAPCTHEDLKSILKEPNIKDMLTTDCGKRILDSCSVFSLIGCTLTGI